MAEDAICRFVWAAKTGYLPVHPRAAEASGAFLSLAETAKANDLEPYVYTCAISSRNFLWLKPLRITQALIAWTWNLVAEALTATCRLLNAYTRAPKQTLYDALRLETLKVIAAKSTMRIYGYRPPASGCRS